MSNQFKIDVNGSPVFFPTEQEMRGCAEQMARFNEHSLTLHRLVEGETPAETRWEQVALVEWDGVPMSNETVEVEATFTASIKVRVRKYDDYGRERDLLAALHYSVSDALDEELGYDEPEEHDFIERVVEHATFAGFDITSVSEVEEAKA